MPRRGGTVTLNPSRGSSLTLILVAPPERSGGVGGWVTTERALSRPAKWFKAPTDDAMGLECVLDIDAVGGPSIERRLRVLRDMGQPDGTDDPPSIRATGDIWEEDQNITWVMQDWRLGERLWNSDGSLRRQHVSVDLVRFDELDTVQPVRVRTTRSSSTARKRHTVIASGNDTLRAVAVRELGDATRWKDLQRWNKLKGVDPDARLRTGTHLVIR
jgi:phage protein U